MDTIPTLREVLGLDDCKCNAAVSFHFGSMLYTYCVQVHIRVPAQLPAVVQQDLFAEGSRVRRRDVTWSFRKGLHLSEIDDPSGQMSSTY